jgi:hypothetical protein
MNGNGGEGNDSSSSSGSKKKTINTFLVLYFFVLFLYISLVAYLPLFPFDSLRFMVHLSSTSRSR